jgi:hypothetical protein
MAPIVTRDYDIRVSCDQCVEVALFAANTARSRLRMELRAMGWSVRNRSGAVTCVGCRASVSAKKRGYRRWATKVPAAVTVALYAERDIVLADFVPEAEPAPAVRLSDDTYTVQCSECGCVATLATRDEADRVATDHDADDHDGVPLSQVEHDWRECDELRHWGYGLSMGDPPGVGFTQRNIRREFCIARDELEIEIKYAREEDQ